MKTYKFDIILNKQTPKAEEVVLETDKNLIEAFAKYASTLDNCAWLASNQVSITLSKMLQTKNFKTVNERINKSFFVMI